MNFLKLLCIVIAALVVNESNGQSKQKASEAGTKAKPPLSIDNFKTPKEIVGCNCTFSESDEKYRQKQFVFAAKNNSIGFVSINKKLIKLKLLSRGNTFGARDHKNIYSNGIYKVIVDTKFKRSTSEEVWWNEGTITVEAKDGRKATKKLVGECGC